MLVYGLLCLSERVSCFIVFFGGKGAIYYFAQLASQTFFDVLVATFAYPVKWV